MSTHTGIFGVPHGVMNSIDEPLPYLVGLMFAAGVYRSTDSTLGPALAFVAGVVFGVVMKAGLEGLYDPA